MKRAAKIFALTLVLTILIGWCYVATQEPHFSFNREAWVMALTRGRYRSYGMEFCSGIQAVTDKPFSTEDGTNWHEGYHPFPRFWHVDLKAITFTTNSRGDTVILKTTSGGTNR